jgi:cupin 2 domain-containing protein
MTRGNIFDLKNFISDSDKELFEPIFIGTNFKAERIISKGHTTPTGEWYDQEQDEWVILLQGEASIEFDNGKKNNLNPGDYIIIPAKKRHRVASTSTEPPCVWLAFHGNITLQDIDI